MRLLLISNSSNAGEGYLEHPLSTIRNFLGTDPRDCLFVPYAGVTVSFDEYTERVVNKFAEIGHKIFGIHQYADPLAALDTADAVVVGGGNTFQLIKLLQDKKLIRGIREKVRGGMPYIGWSAGSNVACPTIRTTNDMPILEPESFEAFGLVRFQINPHYLDVNPEGHAGETREMRIEEFLEVNPDIYVVGLREGTILQVEGQSIELIGPKPARIFKNGSTPLEVSPGSDLSFLV